MEGVRGSIPLPPTTETAQNQRKFDASAVRGRASTSLNEPRTVPSGAVHLGKRRAKRSRKVLDGSAPLSKRSPASPASETGPSRNSKRKFAAAQPNAQDVERHFYWVVRGETSVGVIVQIGKTYKSISADERELRTDTLKAAAADAISASYDKSSQTELLDEGVL